jgi:hypothetical protein
MQKFTEFKRPEMRSERDLFPLYRDPTRCRNDRQRRAYVRDRLAEMAAAGDLFVTECLAIGDPIRTHVLQAIMGHDVDAKGVFRKGRPVPHALKQATVKLRSLKRLREDGVVWEHGTARPNYVEQQEPILIKLPAEESDALTEEQAQTAGVPATDATQAIPQELRFDGTEADVPLAEACMGLTQGGAWVRRARSARMQHFLWRIEEIPPEKQADEEDPQPQPKRGPGRPRKNG